MPLVLQLPDSENSRIGGIQPGEFGWSVLTFLSLTTSWQPSHPDPLFCKHIFQEEAGDSFSPHAPWAALIVRKFALLLTEICCLFPSHLYCLPCWRHQSLLPVSHGTFRWFELRVLRTALYLGSKTSVILPAIFDRIFLPACPFPSSRLSAIPEQSILEM